jgi:hypothetical protein
MNLMQSKLSNSFNLISENKATKCKTMKSVIHNAAGSLVSGKA